MLKCLRVGMKSKILNILSALREARADHLDYYMRGHCYDVYLILKSAFSEAYPVQTIDMHVITKIGESYYDIRGEVFPDKTIPLTTRDHQDFVLRHLFEALGVDKYVK